MVLRGGNRLKKSIRRKNTMTLKMNVKGKERQAMVAEISKILDLPVNYTGVPKCEYHVGNYVIDKEGTITGELNLNLMIKLEERGYEAEKSESFHLITPRGTLLIRERFDTAEQAEQAGYGMYFSHQGRGIFTRPVEGEENSVTFAMVGEMFEKIDTPEVDEIPAPMEADEPADNGRLAIEYPLEGFTPETRINLERLVASKDVLIKKALGVSELPIIELDTALSFPWFPADAEGDTVNAYAQFITALCDTAKKKSRVVAKPQESFENERFAMRVWMIGLGLVGSEYGLCRKQMMTGLEGDSGFRYGKGESTAGSRRDGVHREVLSIRLTPDTLEKLNAIAQTYEGLSRNRLIEQILERYVDAEATTAPGDTPDADEPATEADAE